MKRFLILLMSITFSSGIYAQIRLVAQSKNPVRVGETFQLQFSVDANASGFRAPGISGFDILSGPNSSTSSSYSSINGNISQKITNSYLYYLRARSVGKFTIPAAQVTVDGKTYKSDPITIEVLKGEDAPPNQNNNIDEIGSDDLFVSINLSKSNVYQGEYIIATTKIYTQVDLVSFNDIKFPAFTGFWNQDIETSSNISLSQETINGKTYSVGLLKQNILYPQKQGKLIVDPIEVEVIVRQKVGKARDFFGRIVDRYDNVKKKIKSSPVTVTVKPLPGNKPDNFSGIVGSGFEISSNISNKDIKVTDGVNLSVKLSGNGNLSLINELNIDLPTSFEKYPPTVKENIKNTTSGSTGNKIFEYFMQALEPGDFTIPGTEFCYFDVNKKDFVTIKTEDYKIKVEPGNGQASNDQKTYNPQTEIETKNNDIRYIKQNNLELHEKDSYFAGTSLFYFSYLLAGIIFIIFIFFKRNRIKENADISKKKNRNAGKVSKKRLKNAENLLKQKDTQNFYLEITQAMWGYLSDKLSIPVSELSKDMIREKLVNRGAKNETVTELIDLLNTCEYDRFAPGAEPSVPEDIYKNASVLITTFEKNIV